MKKKLGTLGIALGILTTFTAGVGVGASGTLEQIKAFKDHSKSFEINGDKWIPYGPNGVISPINYEGTTYLPIRAIAEALNIPVEYNSAKQVIHIGGDPRVPLASLEGNKTSPNFIKTNDKAITVQHGEDLGLSYLIDGVSTNPDEPSELIFDLDEKYRRLELVITVLEADTKLTIVGRGPKGVYFGEHFEKGTLKISFDLRDFDEFRLQFYSDVEPGKEGKPDKILISGTVR